MRAALKPPDEGPPPTWDSKRTADLMLFLTLMAMGIAYEIIIVKSYSKEGGVTTEIGLVLIGAAMTPLLLSLWALIFGLGTKRSDDFTRVGITFFAYFVGVMLCSWDVDHVGQWGSKAFYMAMMFIINQLMLIEPDPEQATQSLMTKYKQALASAGTGMALSYFYNFVLPTAQSLEACVKAGTIRIQLEGAQRGQFSDAEFRPVTTPRLNVICPRDLPIDDGDIKKQIRTLTQAKGGLKVGRLLPPQGVGGHRPMFLNFLEAPSEGGAADSEAERTPIMSAMLDIPTIISASYDRRAGIGKTLADEAPSVAKDEPKSPTSGLQERASVFAGCQTAREYLTAALEPCLEALTKACDAAMAVVNKFFAGGAKSTLETASAGESAEEVGLTIAQEMTDFTNALYKLVDSHAVTKGHVTLWSVEPPPFVVDDLVEMCHTDEADSGLDETKMTRKLLVRAGDPMAYTELNKKDQSLAA